VALAAAEHQLLDAELHEAEHQLRELELAAVTAERDAALRALGLDPDAPPPPPDPRSVLGAAMLVHERAQREEVLAAHFREGSTAIYRGSGRRRR
jgi:hypothetical protein